MKKVSSHPLPGLFWVPAGLARTTYMCGTQAMIHTWTHMVILQGDCMHCSEGNDIPSLTYQRFGQDEHLKAGHVPPHIAGHMCVCFGLYT